MSKEMVLTIINNTVLAQPYAGTRAQSFNIVPQSDGSVGIRNSYDDLAVTISENRIWASPYKGNAWQSFSIRHYEDGSCTLHSKYYPVVLEMTDTGVEPKTYIAGHKTQRFHLVAQSDGSTGIRKVCWVFNTYAGSNDLQGSLAATVHFAQSQIFPQTPKPGDQQPYLTARRKALLMVKPLSRVDTLKVTVLDSGGEPIGSLLLNTPYQLPKTAYHLEGELQDVDFTPLPGPIYALTSSSEIAKLSDPSGAFLLEKLQQNAVVEIQTADGHWVRNIHLPSSSTVEGKIVRARSNAGFASTISYSGRGVSISREESYEFKFSSGQWISNFEWANQRLIYAENTWSVEIPARWIKPGIIMHFESGNLSGQLDNIQVGGSTELLINTIDIGMLTAPRDAYAFAKDPDAHREYFQTLPMARMIVSNYQSLHLAEVMLPNGTLLTDFDPSEGGWHTGTMRQRIGKELISLGINHANYGINCSEGEGQWTPFMAAQFTAHNSIGKYANGIVVHGGSGGASMVTLDDSLGNEFSHEIGHNLGLGHYPGGFNGSVHRAADEINSTWGWDMDLGRFLPNFRVSIDHHDACFDNQCQSPFYGHSFGADAMAGGKPMSHLNRFTLHTPYTATLIQTFLQSKVVFASDSATGFRKWDPDTKNMEPYTHRVDVLWPTLASNNDLTEGAISALFNINSIIKVGMQDGNWGPSIQVPPASSSNTQCIISIHNTATYSSKLSINDETITVSTGFNKSYISNGYSWNECLVLDMSMARITASNEELSPHSLARLLLGYSVLNIAMKDGNWAPSIYIPSASQVNKSRIITVEHHATYNSQLHINGLIIQISAGTKRYFISDGLRWIERVQLRDLSVECPPQASGVPVTTLVGYYDPLGELRSYIYPAMHGAYGFLYHDDNNALPTTDCQLWVESGNETLRFKLASHRFQSNVMNKFHINIAESDRPRTAILVCKGIEVLRQTIEPAKVPLTYTINGE